MATCPNCGAADRRLVKSWSMIGKPSKSGDVFKLTMGLYKCDGCDESFRSVLGKEKVSMKELLEGRDQLEMKLLEATQKRAELEKTIQALEDERASLFTEIEALRLIPELEKRAYSLESEVKDLRVEKESLLTRISELMAEKTQPSEDTQDDAPMLIDETPDAVLEPVAEAYTVSSDDSPSPVSEPDIVESGLGEPAAVETTPEPVELNTPPEETILEQAEPDAMEPQAEEQVLEVEKVPLETGREPEPALTEAPQTTPAQAEPTPSEAIPSLPEQAPEEVKPESIEALANAPEQVSEVIEKAAVEAPKQVLENAPEEITREALVETTEVPLPVQESSINQEMAAANEEAITEPAAKEVVEELQVVEDKAILEEQTPPIIEEPVTKEPMSEVVEAPTLDEIPVAPSGVVGFTEVDVSKDAEVKPSITTTSEVSENSQDAPGVILDPIVEPTTVTPQSYDVTSSEPNLVKGEQEQAPTDTSYTEETFTTETREAETVAPSGSQPAKTLDETDSSSKMG